MGKIETLATELGELLNADISKLRGPEKRLRKDINRFLWLLRKKTVAERTKPVEVTPPKEVDPLADLKAMSEDDLRAKAKEAKIKGYALMKKETLIEKLSA